MGSTLPLPNGLHARQPLPLNILFSIITIASVLLVVQILFLPNVAWHGFHWESINEARQHEFHLARLKTGLRKCKKFNTLPEEWTVERIAERSNPRWFPADGVAMTFILRNATLFDGESIFKDLKDVLVKEGVVSDVRPTEENAFRSIDAPRRNLNSAFVTPGLIDMHSHHLTKVWPKRSQTEDTNEINPLFGPLTPFVRVLDSLKAYDPGTTYIRSGGVTTSLILPGSANIIGGEAYIVKNMLRSGKNKEESVADLLLDRGVPVEKRRRYEKLACGENPRRVYRHTRMGNAYIFRRHLTRAKELKEKQEEWCLNAVVARQRNDYELIAYLTSSKGDDKGGLPEELELESTVAILRGQVGVNIHCYEQEDIEDMLLHSKEFGFRIQAFHHALEAWKVPEMIKNSGKNITIATFSNFALYKQEAYDASLYAGKILNEHEVPVAYKSDHSGEKTFAKYLLSEAAEGHSFGLPEVKALQSVTSIPAKSLQQDHRIGYVKKGYDADIVVWDSHPLSVGATPLQVYVDGKPTLDPEKVRDSMLPQRLESRPLSKPSIRPLQSEEARTATCSQLLKHQGPIVITGITASYLPSFEHSSQNVSNLTAVVHNGKLICLDTALKCQAISIDAPVVHLDNGHLSYGITAITSSLGILEISSESSTTDGSGTRAEDPLDASKVDYAKYGAHLDGRAFERARIGGVTRAVTLPQYDGGLIRGVSAGIRTSGNKSILDGGIWEEEVGLHVVVGQESKSSSSTPSVSLAVAKLRLIFSENEKKDNVFGRVVNGSLPLVVDVQNKYDIAQLIKIKHDFPSVNLILYGAAEATALATDIAKADIPVIYTHIRGGPVAFEFKDVLVGPPLTRSAASIFTEANVTFAIAIDNREGDSDIHTLAQLARFTGKFAGLSGTESIALVSSNIKKILGLKSASDLVVWEGDPLEFGATVALAVDGEDGKIVTCWPVSH